MTLTERPLPEAWIEEAEVESLHLPVPDGGVPTRDHVDQFNAHVDRLLPDNLPVLVHCLGASVGRELSSRPIWFTAEQPRMRRSPR